MKKIVWAIILIVLIWGSLFAGASPISLKQLINGNSQLQLIFLTTRIPRTTSLIIAGATLSICGLIMQHLTQNKFVSPGSAGTTDSARLGIVIVMLFFPNAPLLFRSFIAFLFAFMGTILFIYLIHFLAAKNKLMIPLIGVMFGNIFGSIATFFAYQFNLIQNMTSWLQGNFSTVMKGNYELIYLTLPLLLITYFLAYQFTILGMGEDITKNLGLNYQLIQLIGLAIVALANTLILIMVGNIPFLGIIIPNLISIHYSDYIKNTLLLTATTGSAFLLICDIIARTIIAPYEVPVSVVVGIIGSLIFLSLLLRKEPL